MMDPMQFDPYDEVVPLPRAARFPVELRPPKGFVAEDPRTWPRVEGRLEYLHERLLYMPPCADLQQDVTLSVAGILDRWLDTHPGFVAGTNEAGIMLGEDVRAADAAVWAREAVGDHSGRFRRTPPILAVEVAGQEEAEDVLREKGAWYLSHGVQVVWLVLPEAREVVVLSPGGERRCGQGECVPFHPALPDLAPEVQRFFRQLR